MNFKNLNASFAEFLPPNFNKDNPSLSVENLQTFFNSGFNGSPDSPSFNTFTNPSPHNSTNSSQNGLTFTPMRQGQRREREAGETPPRPIRPNPAILKQHAIVTADAQGLRQRDKEKVIQFATFDISKMLISLYAVGLATKDKVSSNELGDIVSQSWYKGKVVEFMRHILMDPFIESYRTGIADFIYSTVRSKSVMLDIPEHLFLDKNSRKELRSTIADHNTQWRSKAKEKIFKSIMNREPNFVLARWLAHEGFGLTKEHFIRASVLRQGALYFRDQVKRGILSNSHFWLCIDMFLLNIRAQCGSPDPVFAKTLKLGYYSALQTIDLKAYPPDADVRRPPDMDVDALQLEVQFIVAGFTVDDDTLTNDIQKVIHTSDTMEVSQGTDHPVLEEEGEGEEEGDDNGCDDDEEEEEEEGAALEDVSGGGTPHGSTPQTQDSDQARNFHSQQGHHASLSASQERFGSTSSSSSSSQRDRSLYPPSSASGSSSSQRPWSLSPALPQSTLQPGSYSSALSQSDLHPSQSSLPQASTRTSTLRRTTKQIRHIGNSNVHN